jgi:hypothetical protein
VDRLVVDVIHRAGREPPPDNVGSADDSVNIELNEDGAATHREDYGQSR